MKKIRVCQLITELGPAGAERIVYELATRLDTGRFEVQVAALRGGAMVRSLQEAGIPTTVLGIRGKWDFLKFSKIRRLAGMLRGRVDILHTHLFHADLAGRLATWSAAVGRLVHTVHVAERRFRPWQYAFARILAGRCDRIVCVSRAVLEHHARKTGLSRDHYTVIPNGIDVAAYSHDTAARQALRSQWAVGPNELLLVCVGRLDVQKGLDVLLDALGSPAGRSLPVQLVIAGEGPQREALSRQIARLKLGSVRLVGFRRDIPAVLSAADILVMPSRWEGFGLAAAEAMAAELPVIATDVPGPAEVVRPGQSGLLVPPENPAALAEAIRRLACDADLRKALASAGLERVRRYYTREKMVAAHERLYEELAGGEKKRARPRALPKREHEGTISL